MRSMLVAFLLAAIAPASDKDQDAAARAVLAASIRLGWNCRDDNMTLAACLQLAGIGKGSGK